MLALLVATFFVAHPGPTPKGWPQADCLSAMGKTACGYDCTSAMGDVKCAQTPFGKCLTAMGTIVCADPSKRVMRQSGGRPPQMQCMTAMGKIACGYACTSAMGEVKCAQTPQGRCESAYGNVTCWDPNDSDDDDGHRRHRDEVDEKAQCLSQYGKTECGYGCVAAYGEIKCAKRPNGTCKAAYGEIVCSD